MPTLESLVIELEVQGAGQVQKDLKQTGQAVENVGTSGSQATGRLGSFLNTLNKLRSAASGIKMPSGMSSLSVPSASGASGGNPLAAAANVTQSMAASGSAGSGMAGMAGTGGMGSAMAAMAGPLAMAVMAFQAIAAIAMKIVETFLHFWQEALNYAKEVLATKSLTGSSDKDAARLTNMFKATGMNPMQDERLMERLTMASRGGQGRQALSLMRINPHIEGTNRLKDAGQLMGDVMIGLSKMQEGAKKTAMEVQLFGQRGAIAMQPLLRMTDKQMAAVKKLADTFDGEGARAITSAQVSMNLLGQTLMERIVIPIMSKVAPVLEWFADKITAVVNFFQDLNDMMDGTLGKELALIIGVVGAVVMTLVVQIGLLVTVLAALLWPMQKMFELIGDFLQSIGLPDFLKRLGIDVSLPKSPNDDKALAAAQRTADATEGIEGHLRGNVGERGRFSQSRLEVEYALKQMMFGGIG